MIADDPFESIRTALNEIESMVSASPPDVDVSFPHVWSGGEKGSDGCGGPPVVDPTTMYVCDEDGQLVYSTTIAELVTDTLDMLVFPRTRRMGATNILRDIASSLRYQADRIEHAIKHGYPEASE